MYKINYNANHKENGRLDSSEIHVEFEGKTYNVGSQTAFNGRDRDSFTCKWNKDELKKLVGNKAKHFEDDNCESGCRKMDWWNPTEILENTLKEKGKIEIVKS